MKRLRLFERRLNLQFADLITGTVGGSVGSGWVGSFLSFLLLSLKPPPQFCRFFYWFALRRQSFFCHHSHLFFCKHQAWQRKPVQICGGGKKSLIFFIAMKYFFSQNLARIFVWWFFLGHQPWSDLGTMYALTRGTKTWVAGKHCYLESFCASGEFLRILTKKPLNGLKTFKTVQIFPDDCQFSGWFQNCPDFSRCRW